MPDKPGSSAPRAGLIALFALLLTLTYFASPVASFPVSVALAGEHDDEEQTPTPTATPTLAAPTPKRAAPPRPAASPQLVPPAPAPSPSSEAGPTRVGHATPADSGPMMVAPRLLTVEPTPGPNPETLLATEVVEPVREAAPTTWMHVTVRGLRGADGLSLHVLQYVGLILGAANEAGVDPAILAALMETEGSGEMAISRAGAAGLMQLMPDKLVETDDAFDPATNILRAAQYIRRLVSTYNGDLASVAGAYFGAIDRDGNVTDATDGNVTGVEYVMIFADAYGRWAVAFEQPTRPIAVRPAIRQRQPPRPAEPEGGPTGDAQDGPERDKWYLYVERPEPAIAPILF